MPSPSFTPLSRAFWSIVLAGLGLPAGVPIVPRTDGQTSIQVPKAGDRGPEADALRYASTLAGHKERVTSVAYSPDGRWIATAAWDGTARLRERELARKSAG